MRLFEKRSECLASRANAALIELLLIKSKYERITK
jgi:hypothetical protein